MFALLGLNYKSGDFKVTYQAPCSVVGYFCFPDVPTKYGLTRLKIMTTYKAGAGGSKMHLCQEKLVIEIDFFDPLGGRPTFTAGRNHCFCTSLPHPYVLRPHFSKSSKTTQSENNVRYWRDCGSGRVDHDDTCLALLYL